MKSKDLQLQYQGYLNTPLLWKNHEVMGIKQLELPKLATNQFNAIIPENLRLGKRVERFVHADLFRYKNIEILLENAQIQNEKITIGEIDCLLKLDEKPIHLEIIYKFYLYDPTIGNSEIDHWIGPNRNDNLRKKLHKLKDKQLPLIHNNHTKPVLQTMHLNSDSIEQRVCFKAQLFTSYNTNSVKFELLNQDCLSGSYLHFSELEELSNCKFYIPPKVDWLLEAQSNVDWLIHQSFKAVIAPLMAEKRAVLCWLKFPNGQIQKLFIVWWK